MENLDVVVLRTLRDWRAAGKRALLATVVRTWGSSPRPVGAPEELVLTQAELVNSFGPEYRMLLIGAGQLTEYLATMAVFNGFAVTVCDPREEYRGAWSVAGATVVADMPDDVVTAFKPDSRTCVVALTHDPKLDDLALLEALKTEAFYVGAIGSRRATNA